MKPLEVKKLKSFIFDTGSIGALCCIWLPFLMGLLLGMYVNNEESEIIRKHAEIAEKRAAYLCHLIER